MWKLLVLLGRTLRGCVDWNFVPMRVLSRQFRSHPTWVRGLKLLRLSFNNPKCPSHPTWVRGLKLVLMLILVLRYKSHPTWVRGLKLICHRTWRSKTVAPYVGAWIETLCRTCWPCRWVVAPYVGAWIETTDLMAYAAPLAVAPYVGAWIETKKKSPEPPKILSHPTWVRGLKLTDSLLLCTISRSHPTWVRGLKPLYQR